MDPTTALRPTSRLVTAYVVIVVATIAALSIMSAAGSSLATQDAWIHAVIVGVFAVLLPLRLRSAKGNTARALRVVIVIAAVLVTVNIVEALIPGLFPAWMRVEMVIIAGVLAAVAVTARQAFRRIESR